jgi:hypothetical protein
MHTFKIALSILALVVTALAGVTSLGDVLIPAHIANLLLVIANALSMMGVSPWPLRVDIARALTGLSAVVLAVVAIHVAKVPPGAGASTFFVILGMIGSVMGVVGRSVLPGAQPTPPPKVAVLLAVCIAVPLLV